MAGGRRRVTEEWSKAHRALRLAAVDADEAAAALLERVVVVESLDARSPVLWVHDPEGSAQLKVEREWIGRVPEEAVADMLLRWAGEWAAATQVLAGLGIRPADTVLVTGGALTEAVADALRGVVGPEGTLLVPLFWESPAGLFAGHLERRGGHPCALFAAAGPRADFLLRDAPRGFPLGVGGPLDRLHQVDGAVLLAGGDHRANPAILLAAHWAGVPWLGAMATGGEGWTLPGCTAGFGKIAPVLRQARIQREAEAVGAMLAFMRIRPLASLATEMLRALPDCLLCDDPACRFCADSRRRCASEAPLPRRGGDADW